MYHAVIFDVDGALVDSNDAHALACVQAITESGRRVEFHVSGRSSVWAATSCCPRSQPCRSDSPEGKAIAVRRREIFQRDYLPHLERTSGAQALLEWLRDDRQKLLVASSAERSARALRLVAFQAPPAGALGVARHAR
jgi:beta-phosphoglucomutase-like phosphatase (HAD superfamily)